MAQALYRKWRPASFDDVVGQEHVTTTLKNQIATNRVGHAYLFVGSRGCGKTTSARIFAKEIGIVDLKVKDPKRAQQIADAISEGRHLDLIEIDAASHTSVDDIRDLRDKVAYQPSELKYKIYIIDEVHMLSTSAFNALLKTLEEPPPHVIFILATTDPQKIPATVLSRCQRFNFRRVPVALIVGRLRVLCEGEGIEADDAALTLIARHATGSLRDAVSLLDQLASSNSLRVTPKDVRDALGSTDAATVRLLVDGMINRDVAAGLDAIQAAVDQGADARQIARQTIDHLRAVMQVRVSKRPIGGTEMSEGEKVELTQLAERANTGLLLRGVRAFSNAINEMRQSTDSQMQLELAYLECVTDAVPVAAAPGAGHVELPPARPASGGSPRPTAATAAVHAPATEAHLPSGPAQDAGSPAETLRAQWQQLIKEVKVASASTASILTYCQPWGIERGVVQIKASQDWQRARLDDTANKNRLIAALNKLLGGTYNVHVFVGQPQMDPADDPVVKRAQQLGGKVRDA